MNIKESDLKNYKKTFDSLPLWYRIYSNCFHAINFAIHNKTKKWILWNPETDGIWFPDSKN